MMRIIAILLTAFLGSVSVSAQSSSETTPIEALIYKYDRQKGAKSLIAKGPAMTVARGLIRKSPAAPIADYVDELTVLNLGKASPQVIGKFLADLKGVLQLYDYMGKSNGTNGIVDVYVSRAKGEYIPELVVYNPKSVSVFSLKGDIPLATLDSMRTQLLPE